jgi:hypothetical protein
MPTCIRTYIHTYVVRTCIRTYIQTYILKYICSAYVRTHIPTTVILHMVFSKNLNVPSSVNPFNLYLCVLSNTDTQQHFLSEVSSVLPTTPRFIAQHSDLRLPSALVSKVIFAPAMLQQTCFLFFGRMKKKIQLLRSCMSAPM